MRSNFFPALLALSGLWIASEIGLIVLRRSKLAANRRDFGSLWLLNLVIYSSVAIGLYLGGAGLGYLPLPLFVRWLGLVLIVFGLALRWWAVLTLRRFFTVDVAIRADHALVQDGPYRLLRHPAYSGSLLSFLGLAVSASSWLSLIIILVPITAAFLYRIHVEERALNEAFPIQYPAYAARTYCLLPGVY